MRIFSVVLSSLLMIASLAILGFSSSTTEAQVVEQCGGSTQNFAVPPQAIATIGSWNETGQFITFQCLFAMTVNKVLTDLSLVCSPQQKLGPFVTVHDFRSTHYLPNVSQQFACPFPNATWSIAAVNPYTVELNVVAVASAWIHNTFATFHPNPEFLAAAAAAAASSSLSSKAVPALASRRHQPQQQQQLHVALNSKKSGMQQGNKFADVQICGNTAQVFHGVAKDGFAYSYWPTAGTTLAMTCFGAFSSPIALTPLAVEVVVICSTDLNIAENRVFLGVLNTAFAPVFDAKYVCPFNGIFAVLWLNTARQATDMYVNAEGQVQ